MKHLEDIDDVQSTFPEMFFADTIVKTTKLLFREAFDEFYDIYFGYKINPRYPFLINDFTLL